MRIFDDIRNALAPNTRIPSGFTGVMVIVTNSGRIDEMVPLDGDQRRAVIRALQGEETIMNALRESGIVP